MTLSVPHVHAKISLGPVSGIGRDAVQFTLNYRPPGGSIPVDPGSGSVAVDAFAAGINAFLNTAAGGVTSALSTYLSKSLSRLPGKVNIQLYAIPQDRVVALGAPFAVRNIDLTGLGLDGYPAEVAAALTYFGDLAGVPERGPGGTRPASSRRGRFFVGPLGVGTGVHDPDTGRVSVQSAFRTGVTAAAQQFLFGQLDQAAWRWVVFSRKLWETHEVAGVYMDDAFDTIRSRGEDTLTRTTVIF